MAWSEMGNTFVGGTSQIGFTNIVSQYFWQGSSWNVHELLNHSIVKKQEIIQLYTKVATISVTGINYFNHSIFNCFQAYFRDLILEQGVIFSSENRCQRQKYQGKILNTHLSLEVKQYVIGMKFLIIVVNYNEINSQAILKSTCQHS